VGLAYCLGPGEHSERLPATRLGLRAGGHRCRGPASTPFCDSAEYGRESPTRPGAGNQRRL